MANHESEVVAVSTEIVIVRNGVSANKLPEEATPTTHDHPSSGESNSRKLDSSLSVVLTNSTEDFSSSSNSATKPFEAQVEGNNDVIHDELPSSSSSKPHALSVPSLQRSVSCPSSSEGTNPPVNGVSAKSLSGT